MKKRDLIYPRKNTMEDVISSLRNEGGPALKVLSITFTNDDFNTSTQELQEAILANNMSTSGVNICSLKILNQCLDQEIHRQCFEFYLRCLEGPENKILDFLYSPTRNNLLLTLVDANRIADAIATNENIRTFTIHEGYIGGLFCKEGTFGCILNAVLKAGVQNLDLRSRTYNGILKSGCFGENLATNTTLKGLRLDYGYAAGDVHRPVDMYDKEMEQLGTILKVNRGLRVICLSSAIISTIGRQHLLESLRDNTTLLELNTRKPPYKSDKSGIHLAAVEEEDELVRHETISIQSQIDHHMVLNKKWKRCSDNNNKSNNSIDDDKDDIPLNLYPNLLENFAKKPLLLYLFLQKNQPRIFTDFSDPSRKRSRRCSMRILAKKRRV